MAKLKKYLAMGVPMCAVNVDDEIIIEVALPKTEEAIRILLPNKMKPEATIQIYSDKQWRVEKPERLYHCKFCGRLIPVDTIPSPEGFSWCKYSRKVDRMLCKHAWDFHRCDLPSDFRSFTEFMRWYQSRASLQWKAQQQILIEAEQIIEEHKSP